jgi:putative ABC transport system substrate-binding protein
MLDILKKIVPGVKRAAVLRDPTVPASTAQFAAIQAVSPLFGVELSTLDARDPSEIERAIAMFAQSPNGSLIAVTGATSVIHRNAIVTLAARYRLPGIYPDRAFVTGGGLISYGPDVIDQYRLAATYIDRILKGEKPADLPVQAATKYELVINLKTAKALGLTIPETLLATADEVIQ